MDGITEKQIQKAHVMLCMIAVMVAVVLRKKVADNGLAYTRETLIEKLATIHDGWIIHDLKKVERVRGNVHWILIFF